MRNLSAVLFKAVVALALLSTQAIAQNNLLNDVNDSCGTEVITECAGCHYGESNVLTDEQITYQTYGACGFCTDEPTCSAAPPTEAELLADAQSTTNSYFQTLFREFMKAMKGTGMMDPDGTITNPMIFAEVFPKCPELGPVIASNFSRDTGYLVRRVTLKTRNSRNTPDDWELQQLKKFELMAANGDPRKLFNITKPDGSILPTKEFEAFEVVYEGDTRGKDKVKGTEPRSYFRYMRSITMPGMPNEPPNLPCLKCHGSINQLGMGVADVVIDEYPHDTAMGYKKGDVRGAWSVKIPLD